MTTRDLKFHLVSELLGNLFLQIESKRLVRLVDFVKNAENPETFEKKILHSLICLHESCNTKFNACVRKKWGYERKLLTVVLVVVHPVFYSHYIILLKRYDMVATTFLHIICNYFVLGK
jgi:hypothetical protein